MKIKYFGIVLVLTLACSNPEEERPGEKLAQNLPEQVVTSSNKLLTKIIGKGDGLIRGVKFGDDMFQIKASETISQFEEEADHVGFTFDTRNLETVDILYYQDNNQKLNGIQLDIYMNSEASGKDILKAFTEYYTALYGKPITDIGMPTWNLTNGGKVIIKPVINKFDHGLQINYVKD